MNNLDEKQKKTSNKNVDWAKQYNFYEIELRDMYRTVSKPQNESHFEMLKSKGSNYLKKDKVFCEIGFSAGLTLRFALKYFGKVFGLDIAPKNVEITSYELKEEGFKNFELYTSDIMIFNESFMNKFDVISFIHGLEHFTIEDYPIILKNIRKYLKENGIFTGALPYKNRFNFRMCPDCGTVFEIDGHVSSHDIESLTKVFKVNGYKIIHIDNFNFKYTLKNLNILKRIYYLIHYLIFSKHPDQQIEYIVQPC